MARDPYADQEKGLAASAGHAEAVVPSDTTDLDFVARGLYVGGTGDVKVTMVSGSDVVFKAVPIGTVLNIRFARVKATGTTATLLVALV